MSMDPSLALYINNQHDIDRIQTPASHRNDPDSSRIAEEKITSSGTRKQHHLAVYKLVCAYPGHTSAELGIIGPLSRAQIARRLPELEPKYIKRGALMRKCNITGSTCVTWYPVEPAPQGEFVLERKKENAQTK